MSLAGGDARTALNVLEGATALAESEEIRDADGRVSPTLEDVEAAAQQRVLAYDRAGDGHYDTVSARSSRACAATTRTPRSTGSRR